MVRLALAGLLALGALLVQPALAAPPNPRPVEEALVAQHGEAQRVAIRRGLRQALAFWRAEDGGQEAFTALAQAHYAGTAAARDALFQRLEQQLEVLHGHYQEIGRQLRAPVDLDGGALLPVDAAFAAYDPGAHLLDDFFGNQLAFAVLLNFPIADLEARLAQGDDWSRRQWAEVRLAERFAQRIPSSVRQRVAQAHADSERYIAQYNIWMHHLLDQDGQRPFPAGLRLLSHWNLRDEIRAQYSEGEAGLSRQRLIQRVMERIIAQEIPEVVVDNPGVDWDPHRNTVAPAAVTDGPSTPVATPRPAREPDTRYAHLLAHFHAQREVDRYMPHLPTYIARRFEEDRQIPEAQVRTMFEQVLGAAEAPAVAALIQQRLGRPLEPFDLWYNGFRARGQYTETALDARVRRRYPDAAAFAADMPRLLRMLGFPAQRAERIAALIEVEPARGSGHAMGAQLRGMPARLRTRIGANGMDYKGYNIAVHELGHNVEQTVSLNEVDYWLLNGVPNTAFTEALAFVFQSRDLELLGLQRPDPGSRGLAALDRFWSAFEIAGVALVDMEVWRWMYAHPAATPAELRQATLSIARRIWNRWYAPVFGHRDQTLLAVYSHMIQSALYLPDYPLGHMIAAQIERHLRTAPRLGVEFERMARLGRLTPDLWMRQATGAPVGPQALLADVRDALEKMP